MSGSRRAVVVMRWLLEAGVGFCDAEGHGAGAVGEGGEPVEFLGVRSEAGDHCAADRRGDDHHEEGAAYCAEFFEDDGEFGDAAASTSVCLRQVDAEVAQLGCLQPEFLGVAVLGDDGGDVVAAVAFAEGGHCFS